MSSYWIDTDTLVWANNESYPLSSKVGETFWNLIAEGVATGLVKMPRRVYKEITEGRDKRDLLAQWLERRESLCIPFTKEIQDFAISIGEYVYSNLEPVGRHDVRHVNRFANGADPWLIAHAAIDSGVVASREKPEPLTRRPKVPDICKLFNVHCIHLKRLVFCLENDISPDECKVPYAD